ncbi:MAG: ACT domain-containing protein [Candidatus Aminicenantes bacterium]|nr:ACT domain-containing protein [Candidatus Aminicenantes bacterium]
MIERATEIYVILENKPSQLGDLCSFLAENEINIDAIGVFHDTAKIIVQQLNKAVKLLSKLNYTTELRDVLKVDLENRPGSLAEITTKLGDEGINIEYCYGTLSRKGNGVSIVMDVSDIDRACQVLGI